MSLASGQYAVVANNQSGIYPSLLSAMRDVFINGKYGYTPLVVGNEQAWDFRLLTALAVSSGLLNSNNYWVDQFGVSDTILNRTTFNFACVAYTNPAIQPSNPIYLPYFEWGSMSVLNLDALAVTTLGTLSI